MIKNHNILLEPGKEFNPYRLFVGSFIPNALMKFKGLSLGAKLVWARLAQFAGEKGECFPAIETIAEEVGIEKRQCLRYIQELEKERFIRIEKAEGRDKLQHKTNRYYFLWHIIFAPESPETPDIYDTSRSVGYDTQRESDLRESKNSLPLTPSSEGESERDLFLKIKNLKTFKNYDNDELLSLLSGRYGLKAFIELEKIDKKERAKFDSDPKIKDPGAYALKTLSTLYPAERRYRKNLIKEKTYADKN